METIKFEIHHADRRFTDFIKLLCEVDSKYDLGFAFDNELNDLISELTKVGKNYLDYKGDVGRFNKAVELLRNPLRFYVEFV